MPEQKTQTSRFDADSITRWIVAIVGVFVVFGGIYQIRSYLYIQDRVFAESRAKLAEVVSDYGSASLDGDGDAADLVAQTQADPDQDGLSTFDELNIYGTSPYLSDTDSDGVSDSEEIAANTDPNCPEGEACVSERTGGDGTTTAAEEAYADLNLDASDVVDPTTVDPAKLRADLIASGVPEEEVNSISDENLVTLYAQAVNPSQSNTSVENIDEIIAQYRSLSADEKRDLLIQSGANADEVAALSDAQVDAILEDSITQTLQQLGDDTTTQGN